MAQQNSINNASSQLTIDPGASGDSFVQFDINTTGEFRIGVDDDDSDKFKISQGSALGTNDTFIMTAAGERTMPLQPAFRAVPSGHLDNVTGDGTAYTVVFATESFDQNADFDGTSTFTAPVTGLYYFGVSIQTDETTSTTQETIEIDVNSGTLYSVVDIDPSGINLNSGAAGITIGGNILLSLSASDTVAVVVTISGTTKTVDILSTRTFFNGYLVA